LGRHVGASRGIRAPARDKDRAYLDLETGGCHILLSWQRGRHRSPVVLATKSQAPSVNHVGLIEDGHVSPAACGGAFY
jgi:hypothetical protein